jgi:hypothetical protein
MAQQLVFYAQHGGVIIQFSSPPYTPPTIQFTGAQILTLLQELSAGVGPRQHGVRLIASIEDSAYYAAALFRDGFITGSAQLVWTILSSLIDLFGRRNINGYIPSHNRSITTIQTYFNCWLNHFRRSESLHNISYNNFTGLPQDLQLRQTQIFRNFSHAISLIWWIQRCL